MARTRSVPCTKMLRLEALEARVVPSFLPPVKYDLGGPVTHAAVADFNGDGNADTAVTFGARASILLGDGIGGLGTTKAYRLGASTAGLIRAADVNLDGATDLAITQRNSDQVAVLLGNGDGTFKLRHAKTGKGPVDVAVGDVSGDGKPDLVTVEDGTTNYTLSVMRGNSDGTFELPQTFDVPGFPYGVAIADVDGDGVGEPIASTLQSGLHVLIAGGRTTYASKCDGNIEVADFNDDDAPDIVVGNSTIGSKACVFLNVGDGTFQPGTAYRTGASPYTPLAADFNHDGILDIATANLDGASVSVLPGVGDGTFQTQFEHDLGFLVYRIASGDLNHDRFPDIVAVGGSSAYVVLNDTVWPTPIPPPGPGHDPASPDDVLPALGQGHQRLLARVPTVDINSAADDVKSITPARSKAETKQDSAPFAVLEDVFNR